LVTKLFGNTDPIGKSVRVKNASFQVIGIMEAKGSFLGTNQDDTAFVPLTTLANRLVGRRNSPYGIQVTFISVAAKDESSMGAAQFQIENLLRLRHKITKYDDFNVSNQKDICKQSTLLRVV
jgi:putative ABC transport system permease protein